MEINNIEGVSVYDSQTIFKKKGKPAIIQIAKWGHIRFSVAAVRLLGLKQDDKISFITSELDKRIIYFQKNNKGLPLSKTSRGKSEVGLGVCCRPLTKKLLHFFSYSESKTFDITDEVADFYGQKCWFILKEKKHIPLKWKKIQ